MRGTHVQPQQHVDEEVIMMMIRLRCWSDARSPGRPRNPRLL